MTLKKIVDYILGLITNNSPDYVLGVKNGNAVKVQLSSGNGIKLIGTISFNMNSTSDQPITLTGGTKFIVTDYVVRNASVNLDTANDLQIWSGASRGGYQIGVSAISNKGVSELPTANNFVRGGIVNSIPSLILGTTIYGSLTTPQGVSATANIDFYGYVEA